MADELLQQRETAWFIAAARLQPKRSSRILRSAWVGLEESHYSDHERVLLMAALAELGDEKDYLFLSRCFFTASPTTAGGMYREPYNSMQSEFFDRLPHHKPTKATRQMVARLIRDTRFDAAPVSAVRASAALLNAWSKSPLFDIQEIYRYAAKNNDPAAEKALEALRDRLRLEVARLIR